MLSDPWFSKCIELLQRLSLYIDSHGETGILLKPQWVPAFALFGIEVSNGLQASSPPSLPCCQVGPGCCLGPYLELPQDRRDVGLIGQVGQHFQLQGRESGLSVLSRPDIPNMLHRPENTPRGSPAASSDSRGNWQIRTLVQNAGSLCPVKGLPDRVHVRRDRVTSPPPLKTRSLLLLLR